jgi:hypothetical protein
MNSKYKTYLVIAAIAAFIVFNMLSGVDVVQ